jgi:hypothetical protein
MRRRRSYTFPAFLDSLESRLSLSSVVPGQAPPVVAPAPVVARVDQPLPPPDPEPDPGPFPGDDSPIIYAPLLRIGPVGPGFHP